jgi:hypothetical protein
MLLGSASAKAARKILMKLTPEASPTLVNYFLEKIISSRKANDLL